MITIRLRDWTETPGGRYRQHGEWSGEAFREDVLAPALAVDAVTVDLSGVAGLPACWLEEVFGGMVRRFGSLVATQLDAVCEDNEDSRERALAYMEDERDRQRKREDDAHGVTDMIVSGR